MNNAGLLYVVSGPSGVGKSTIIRLTRDRVKGLDYSISHTSRKPRGMEKSGVEYHFVERDVFQRMIELGDFLEWAEVYGALYGTSLSGVQEQTRRGWDIILDLDVQGAMNIKRHFQESVLIFILPPSMDALQERLKQRATEDEKTMELRLEKAAREIEHCVHYDYLVINRTVETAVDELRSIILAERCRRSRLLPKVSQAFRIPPP